MIGYLRSDSSQYRIASKDKIVGALGRSDYITLEFKMLLKKEIVDFRRANFNFKNPQAASSPYFVKGKMVEGSSQCKLPPFFVCTCDFHICTKVFGVCIAMLILLLCLFLTLLQEAALVRIKDIRSKKKDTRSKKKDIKSKTSPLQLRKNGGRQFIKPL